MLRRLGNKGGNKMSDRMFVIKILLCAVQALLVATQIATGKWWLVIPVLLITAVIWNI